MKDNSFVDYIVYDILGHIEGIRAKPMFGGVGIYVDTKIVGIIVSGELYLKADEALVAKYTALGCHPFTYERNGKSISMKYMSATEEMLEDRHIMEERVYESLALSGK